MGFFYQLLLEISEKETCAVKVYSWCEFFCFLSAAFTTHVVKNRFPLALCDHPDLHSSSFLTSQISLTSSLFQKCIHYMLNQCLEEGVSVCAKQETLQSVHSEMEENDANHRKFNRNLHGRLLEDIFCLEKGEMFG